jgi:hypothetical protein
MPPASASSTRSDRGEISPANFAGNLRSIFPPRNLVREEIRRLIPVSNDWKNWPPSFPIIGKIRSPAAMRAARVPQTAVFILCSGCAFS